MTEPARPLGAEGRRLWSQWAGKVDDTDLLVACELADERGALRLRVIRGNEPADRAGLRTVDERMGRMVDDLRRAAAWRAYGEREA